MPGVEVVEATVFAHQMKAKNCSMFASLSSNESEHLYDVYQKKSEIYNDSIVRLII